jgi:Cof subfamily protein (haloacid dehalogenase superfamily)
MSPRLIALDLDGTLLDPTGRIRPRSVAALEAARDAGWWVVAATGRPPHMANDLLGATTDAFSHGVMGNGTMICAFPGPDVLLERTFAAAVARDVVTRLRVQDPRFGFALATEGGFAHERGFAERLPALHGLADPDADVLHLEGSVAIKLMVFHHDRSAHELLHLLPATLGDDLQVSHLGADAVEVGPAGIDKGTGLAWLCDRLGVDAQHVVAFGDEYNDHSMLQWAGHGVAMGNADDVTKALADEVAPSNADDGVAVVLERLLTRSG